MKKTKERKRIAAKGSLDHSPCRNSRYCVVFQGDLSTGLRRCFFLFPPMRVWCVACACWCIRFAADSLRETNRKKRDGREEERTEGGKNVRVLEEEDCTRGLRPVAAVERVCTGVRDDTLYIEAPLTAHPP